MHSRNWLLVKGAAVILLLWGVIAVVAKVAGSMKPSPAKILSYAQNNPLDDLEDPDERKQVIGRIAEMMNQLEPSDLKELEETGDREAQRELFSSMSQEEQWYFMERRMGRAFTQMMGVFNEMERDKRKEMVEQALSRIRKRGDDGGRFDGEDADPEMVEKVASAGLEAYFRDASAETKIDLAPLMEEVQSIMSSPDRGRRRRNR